MRINNSGENSGEKLCRLIIWSISLTIEMIFSLDTFEGIFEYTTLFSITKK